MFNVFLRTRIQQKYKAKRFYIIIFGRDSKVKLILFV